MSAAVESIHNKVVGRDEWLAARKALLAKEKELTKASDDLAAQRRALPMVKVDKKYSFTDETGSTVTLADLFHGKDQLIVYHFMYAPSDEKVCRGCSHAAESFPDVRHLRFKDTNFVCISRAPTEKLQAYKKANGWTWPWYSSGNSDFNYDFHATIDESVAPVELNFRNKEEMKALDKTWWTGDVPGYSVFYRQGNDIFHTYSTFQRGGDKLMSTMTLLDMTPLGRHLGTYGPAEFKLKSEYGEAI